MAKKSSNLSVDELLALAVRATQQGKPAQAAQHVTQVLKQAPDNAHAHLLQGGMEASQGNRDRAIQHMSKAVELDPQLSSARFQLGLMYLTSGEIAAAERIWQPLEELSEQHALLLFKRGMLHLIRDEFAECITAIEAGVENNRDNPTLSREMGKIAERARKAIANKSAS